MPKLVMTPLELYIEKWRKGCGHEECSKSCRVVHCRGDIPGDVLFVGEAPGKSEDTLGEPFRGQAGRALDRVIANSLAPGITYCIANLVGCIPHDAEGTGKGAPGWDQIIKCKVRLEELIDLVKPKCIVCVGVHAEQAFEIGYKHSVKADPSIPRVAIEHPSSIARKPYAHRGLLERKGIVAIRAALAKIYGE